MKPIQASIGAIAAALILLPGCSQSSAQEGSDIAQPVDPLHAERPPEPAPAKPEAIEIPHNIRRQIHNNPIKYQERALSNLFEISETGVITAEDNTRLKRSQLADHRARNMTRIMAFDLNGDGSISDSEITDASIGKRGNEIAVMRTTMLTYDSDEDGILQYSEAVKSVDEKLAKNASRRRSPIDNLMMFDENLDGTLTSEEVNSVISKIAAEPLPEAQRTYDKPTPVANCALKAPSANAEIVAISGYEGPGLSTVSVVGQSGETSVATINIEPGEKPIYLFATAHGAVIWKLSGDTERVEHMAVQPSASKAGPGAGVVGLDKEKVSFAGTGTCGRAISEPAGAQALILKSRLTSALGRSADHLIATYNLTDVGVPSGVVPGEDKKKRRTGPVVVTKDGTYQLGDGAPKLVTPATPSKVQSELLRFYPEGVIQIDPESVIAPAPVEAYKVLPQQAGLIQLINSGHLRYTSDGFFVIEKTFDNFPAGLHGAHGVKFLLRKGVEMPGGSAGHSQISDEDGNCLTGSRCR